MDIAIDFDGTFVTHEYPHIGLDIGAFDVVKKLIKNKHRIILNTMRSGINLWMAVEFLKEQGIDLFGININPEQVTWTNSPKVFAQLNIDDVNLGCPLKFDPEISKRPFVDWVEVEKILIKKGLI
jgi:hypothetical protein